MCTNVLNKLSHLETKRTAHRDQYFWISMVGFEGLWSMKFFEIFLALPEMSFENDLKIRFYIIY